MIKDSISIILAVHNKENFIENVVKGILNNISKNVVDMFVIFADCNDNSENEILFALAKYRKDDLFIVNLVYSEYNNKLIANNIGCQSSENEYSLIVPDNMIIDESNFDERLLRTFESNESFPDPREGNIMVLVKNSELEDLNFEGMDLDE
jgi:hypothetical protein